jgi:hypothetical protein
MDAERVYQNLCYIAATYKEASKKNLQTRSFSIRCRSPIASVGTSEFFALVVCDLNSCYSIMYPCVKCAQFLTAKKNLPYSIM